MLFFLPVTGHRDSYIGIVTPRPRRTPRGPLQDVAQAPSHSGDTGQRPRGRSRSPASTFAALLCIASAFMYCMCQHLLRPCGHATAMISAGASSELFSHGKFPAYGVTSSEQTNHDVCPLGYYCKDGVATVCPAGTFGDSEELEEEACSGQCPAGGWEPTP